MSKRDITKETLYEGVKLLLDVKDNHIHLTQQKLYTQFSVAFQYLLYMSTKSPGHYIIRVEDSYLLEKLQRKAKDQSTRSFIRSLALPRKLKYQQSVFHLDFFKFTTWNNTNDLPKDRIKAALIVKNATKAAFDTKYIDDEEDEQLQAVMASMPKNYHISSLTEFVPKTITIAFDEDIEGLKELRFPFIKEEPKENLVDGVNIASDINIDDLVD